MCVITSFLITVWVTVCAFTLTHSLTGWRRLASLHGGSCDQTRRWGAGQTEVLCWPPHFCLRGRSATSLLVSVHTHTHTNGMYKMYSTDERTLRGLFYSVCQTHLNIPVLVEIVNTRDEASIAVRVVNMAHVPCPVTWVTSYHSLQKKEETISGAKKTFCKSILKFK